MASTKVEVDATWETPLTWTQDQVVTPEDMNSISDNLNALKSPAYAIAVLDEASDFTTTSTSFVDVDAAGAQLSFSIETGGGLVEIGFAGSGGISTARTGYLDVLIDGTPAGGDDGLIAVTFAHGNLSFVILRDDLAAGVHTFVLRWKVSNGDGTFTLHAGAGTSARDVHPRFWVMER